MMVGLRAWLHSHPKFRKLLIRLYNVGWSLFPDHDGVPGPHVKRFSERVRHSAEILEIGGAGLSYRKLFSCENFICLDLCADARVDLQGSTYMLPSRMHPSARFSSLRCWSISLNQRPHYKRSTGC